MNGVCYICVESQLENYSLRLKNAQLSFCTSKNSIMMFTLGNIICMNMCQTVWQIRKKMTVKHETVSSKTGTVLCLKQKLKWKYWSCQDNVINMAIPNLLQKTDLLQFLKIADVITTKIQSTIECKSLITVILCMISNSNFQVFKYGCKKNNLCSLDYHVKQKNFLPQSFIALLCISNLGSFISLHLAADRWTLTVHLSLWQKTNKIFFHKSPDVFKIYLTFNIAVIPVTKHTTNLTEVQFNLWKLRTLNHLSPGGSTSPVAPLMNLRNLKGHEDPPWNVILIYTSEFYLVYFPHNVRHILVRFDDHKRGKN